MSGIVGVVYLDGRPADIGQLNQMLATVAHRGVDGAGVWSRGCVGLGHRMLWTTPESRFEKLPFASEVSNLSITADARIDNRDELIATLGFTGRPTERISDSELILAAYEKWGETCPEKLLGDFAFVIWDAGRQLLFCARDPAGIKPFYYYHSDRIFVFASEIKAILCLPEVPQRLNELKVAEYLVKIFEDKVMTLYEGVLRLPGAHSLIVNRTTLQISRYWSWDSSSELRLSSNQEYAEAVRETFTEAVRCRLRSAFPIASTLSGGLDSSSIACTAQRLLAAQQRPSLHTFSAIFPSLSETAPSNDERNYIDTVLGGQGFEPHYVHADSLSPLADILWRGDEVIPAPNLYMDCALFDAAHQQGFRVLFSGNDGDTTISYGYEFLAQLARSGRWGTLMAETTALAQRMNVRRWKIIKGFALKPLIPKPALEVWRRLRGHKQSAWAAGTVINPIFAREIGLTERIEALLADDWKPMGSVRENHVLNFDSGLLMYLLELLDKASAPCSLELRYPFFDRRLMELSLSLPPEQKLNQGWDRVVMRRSMEGILPPEIQWRTGKGNLSANFQGRFLSTQRATLDNVMSNELEPLEKYVDMPALRAAYQRYTSHPVGREQDAVNVFVSVTMALWMRQAGLRA